MKVLVIGDSLSPRSIEMLARMREAYPDMEVIGQTIDDEYVGESFTQVWYDEISPVPAEWFEYSSHKPKQNKPYYRVKERY